MPTITNPKNGQTIESPFATVTDAARKLSLLMSAGTVNRSDFTESMLDAGMSGKASAAQAFWVHKLAMNEAPKPTDRIDLSGVNALFAKAGAKLKRPAVVLALPSGDEMKVSIAGDRSRYTGQTMLASPSFGGAYFGRIDKCGDYFPGRDATEASLDLLKRFAADPLKVAAEHGHLTGKCCFCNRKLDNESSTALGYGPVCAKKWGLVHGTKAAREAALA